MAYPRAQIQADMLNLLRGDPCIAALFHATHADVVSRAALRAVTGQAEGNVRLVTEATDSVITFTGLYWFDADNVSADDNLYVIEPTVGLGAWVLYNVAASLSWGSGDNAGHIFMGIREPFLRGARNRGRMPFVELDVQGGNMRDFSTSGGVATFTATMRCWWRDNRVGDYRDDMLNIMDRVARALRNWYFVQGTNTGYCPGQGSSGVRRYADAEITYGPTIELPGALYADVTADIEVAYGESTLGGTT